MFTLRPLAAVLAASLAVATALMAPTAASGALTAPDCGAFDDPIYQRVKPDNGASLITPWASEAANAARYGFIQDNGTVFRASRTPQTGLVPVKRLWKNEPQDFMASADQAEWGPAIAEDGYGDQGVSFYVSPVAGDCLVPVYRYLKQGRHRLAVTEAARTGLESAAWRSEGVSFWVAPPAPVSGPEEPASPPPLPPLPTPTPRPPVTDGDTRFSFAVYPDTQQEVFGTDPRFLDRTSWLVREKDALDLRFVTHTGDVVNWDTSDHAQYEVASKAMVPLEEADIPYSLAIGNHDTQATGPGGSARDPQNTRRLQRDTTTFNRYFTASRYGGVSGAFEAGKVDNVYSLYEAGGVQWMVLVLELWPRQSVVDWAKTQVAAHPDANVVVVTHDYLTSGGGIDTSAGYGDTSPQQLYDQLISQYANIRMVVSGHVGFAGNRVDTGKNGNKIYSFLTAIHSNTTNPIRLFEVDTKAGTLETRIYAPHDDQSWPTYNQTVSGIDWVR